MRRFTGFFLASVPLWVLQATAELNFIRGCGYGLKTCASWHDAPSILNEARFGTLLGLAIIPTLVGLVVAFVLRERPSKAAAQVEKAPKA